jgi:O-antigen ligase
MLLSTAIVWTFSRGGLLALLLVLGVALGMQRFRRERLLVLGLALAPAVLTAPQVYWERLGATPGAVTQAVSSQAPRADASAPAPGIEASNLAPDGDAAGPGSVDSSSPAVARDSASDRSRLAQVGALIFLDHPLSGVGLGNYLAAYPRYVWRVDPTFSTVPRHPHNTPLQIAAETGLLGLASFAALVVAAVAGARDAKRRFASAGLRREALLVEAVELAIYGYLVTSFFLNHNNAQRWLYILLALAAIGRQLAVRSIPSARPAPPISTPLARPT